MASSSPTPTGSERCSCSLSNLLPLLPLLLLFLPLLLVSGVGGGLQRLHSRCFTSAGRKVTQRLIFGSFGGIGDSLFAATWVAIIGVLGRAVMAMARAV